jgi:hypothetical protein
MLTAIESPYKSIKCENCRAKLTVKYAGAVISADRYFTIFDTHQEFQINRTFVVYKHSFKKSLPKYFVSEVTQHWVSPKKTVSLYQKTLNMSWEINWQHSGDLELRGKSSRTNELYKIEGDLIPGENKIQPVLRQRGFTDGLPKIVSHHLWPLLYKDPKVEIMLKNEKTDWIYEYMMSSYHQEVITKLWHVFRICIRHKFEIPDFRVYCDYLYDLNIKGKDLYNPKYVCNHDYIEEHRARVRWEKKKDTLEKAMKSKRSYYAKMKHFEEFVFEHTNIKIVPLVHIEEVIEEGQEMNHCVARNEYYAKEKSLLFTSFVNNEKAETIEIELPAFSFGHVRGKSNDFTPYHDDILEAIKKAMPQIKKLSKPLLANL